MKLLRKKELAIDFMKQSRFFNIVSLVMILISIGSFFTRGMNYGIDFEGGIQIETTSTEKIEIDQVRKKLSFLKGLSIQTIGTEGNSILIEAQPTIEENSNVLLEKIKSVLGETYSYNKVEIIGPTIGDELKYHSLLASVLALTVILIYIWFRFEWPFAINCILALAHDLIIVLGVFSLFQIEFDMVVVAGLLSLAGYDCNDTIVTYDRVRENLKKYRKMEVVDLLNKSVNETLSRTILTSLTTLFVVLVLLFVGGETLFGFSIVMVLGTVLGTYSSIYLAVPMLEKFDIKKLGSTIEEPNFNS